MGRVGAAGAPFAGGARHPPGGLRVTLADALDILAPRIPERTVCIHANGYVSRAGCAIRDRDECFYMIGSMGLAPSIGLGIALAKPTRRVLVLDGDGNLLMNPAALGRGDLCHRELEFATLLDSIRARLLAAFAPAGGFTAVVLTGSGTAALEAAVTSVLSARGRLVVVANGVYGERIAVMAGAARLPHTVVESPWTAPPDLDAVDRALAAPDVEAVAVVHHETTTGLRNPVAEVARMARSRGKLVLVDSISGLAG